MTAGPLQLEIPNADPVDAVWDAADQPRAVYLLAHGAGAPMDHRFMGAVARRLAAAGISTLRYNFPYMQAGKRRPDRPTLLHATVGAALRHARLEWGGPLFAGGKSMGGRMTSQAAAEGLLQGVDGLVFFGFPLHPPGKLGKERANHLDHVDLPLLFLQGSRDSFAQLDFLRTVTERVGATLHIVDDADHSFHVPKRAGRTDDEVLDELCGVAVEWMEGVANR